MADELKKIIRDKAKSIGFEAVGFTAARADPAAAEALSRFLADGRQGDMAWLNNSDGRHTLASMAIITRWPISRWAKSRATKINPTINDIGGHFSPPGRATRGVTVKP